MKYPLKLIEWHDAYIDKSFWFDADQLSPPESLIVQSMGFEVNRTETHVTLAQSVNSNSRLCTLIMIPLGMIVREQTFRNRLT